MCYIEESNLSNGVQVYMSKNKTDTEKPRLINMHSVGIIE